MRRITILLLTLLALALRLWALDAKGLDYDEAATALIARATPLDIIQFHWYASFEHPPFWQLLIHLWSKLCDQSEFALRFLPALAGTLLVPLVWQLVQGLEIGHNLQTLCLISTLLVLFSPVLVLYSQEARMYTIVVALAMASLLAGRRLLIKPSLGALIVFLLIQWAMLGFHYYSVLLLIGEFLAFGWVIVCIRPNAWHLWVWLLMAMLFAVLPLLFWMAFAPGFQITAKIVLQGVGGKQPTVNQFLADLWQDLTFGAIRWQPPQATLGYLLLPLCALGIIGVLFQARRRFRIEEASAHAASYNPWALLPIFVGLTPILFSTVLFRTLATRYILFVTPLLYILMAVGIVWLGRLHRLLGTVALGMACVVAATGIAYYFGPYEKSEYREMAAYVTTHVTSADALLLEAPRQHLLAKYYLPATFHFYTAPKVVLPAYWPISAPPVVPEQMDGQIQSYLRQHRAVWLVLTAENEVDPGEFVPKYLTAVAYKEDCRDWLDVQLCLFVSPRFVHQAVKTKPDVRFANEMLLQSASITVTNAGLMDRQVLFVRLNWRAIVKPGADYRVTLRLLDAAGKVVSQRDDYPIGALLPPSTWQAGDEKPGFMVLPILSHLGAGDYRVTVGLYDPATSALLTHTHLNEPPSTAPLVLASVAISDTIAVRNP